MKRIIIFNILILVIFSGMIWAAVPAKMNFQGKISPVPQGGFPSGTELFFRILNTSWGQTFVTGQNLTINDNGIFNVELANLPIDDFDGVHALVMEIWLNKNTKIGSQSLLSVPYAFRAAVAEGLPGVTVTNGTIKATAFQGDGSGLTGLASSQWTTNGSNISFNNGNVGIGINPPTSSLLHIASPLRQPESVLQQNYTGWTGPMYVFQKSRGSLTTPQDVINGDEIFTVLGRAYSGSFYQSTASIKSNVDGTFTSGQRTPSNLSFFTNTAGQLPTEKMRINSAGNVGIGTTNPGTANLAVMGMIGLNTNNPGAGLDIYTNGDSYGIRIGDSSNSNLRIAGTAGGATGYGLLQTFTGGSNAGGKLALQSLGGNVGIGITNPSYKLDIYDATNPIVLRAASASTNGAAFYLDNSSRASGRNWSFISGNAANGYLSIKDETAGADRVVIDTNGKVGIGTTTPAASFHVIGNGLFQGDVQLNAALQGENTNAAGYGVKGNGTFGVYGQGLTNQPSVYTYGGYFESYNASGMGVYGSGSTIGVNGKGVTGVRGDSDSGIAVRGVSNSGVAVRGESTSGNSGYFIGGKGLYTDMAQIGSAGPTIKTVVYEKVISATSDTTTTISAPAVSGKKIYFTSLTLTNASNNANQINDYYWNTSGNFTCNISATGYYTNTLRLFIIYGD